MKPTKPMTSAKTTRLLLRVLFISLPFAFTACGDKEARPRGRYERGVFIVNEGGFGNGNGEISFFNLDSNKVTNGIFGRENGGRPPGDVIQSMTIHENAAYIVANNSNKLLVMDARTFRQTAEIALRQPRHMVTQGTTGYVTEWVSNNFSNPPKGRVAIINLQANTTAAKDTITTNGLFPNQMVLSGSRLYVLNSLENTVSILNTQTKAFEKKVVVGSGPSGMVLDRNNDLWIMASGKADYSKYPIVSTLEPGRLMRFRISGAELLLQSTFTFPAFGGGNLIANPAQDRLYYSFNGQVFDLAISASSLNTQPVISRRFYGIGIDPSGTTFYGGTAPDFRSNGKMIRYSLTTKTALDSATVGIAPNGFVFR